MESQNTEQLTLNNPNKLSENLNLSEAIAVNENHDTRENNSLGFYNSLEPSFDEFNKNTVAPQVVKPLDLRTQKALCWDKELKKWVNCPIP